MADERNPTIEQEAGLPAAESAAATAEAADLQRQRDEYYDRLLRQTAEFDNYRKRVDRERQAQSDAVAADVLADLLPIVDDFDRALKSEGADVDSYRRGVELIDRRLHDLLRKRGLRPIDALGTDFDPHLHEAVAYDEAPGHRDGEVIEEFSRGYMLGDRLLRPARVKVAKG
ncbi:MAG TPA: nucleotide exchange factor GrpE [Vicinamibacterales bacterium]|nr:nucleotide exchange factor GrpE [Vicinamibacterales bacterium]